MKTGTVKWFNNQKGFGFIAPETGSQDVFVHISAVERAGLSTLNEGQKVSYELATNKGKTSAANLKLLLSTYDNNAATAEVSGWPYYEHLPA